MNTFLSSSQETLKEQYLAYARQEIEPIARRLEDGEIPLKDVLARLGQAGYLGITIAREYSGQGLGLVEQVLFVEAVSQYEPGLGLTLSSHAQVIELIKRFGTDVQKSRYLPLLARGEAVGAFAINEADAGSDHSRVASKASSKGDSFVLDGEKIWVVNGRIASLFVVAAREGDGEGSALSLFLVDGSDAKSIKIESGPLKLGLRSATTDNVVFNQHSIAASQKLAGAGNEQINFAMDVAKVIVSAAAVGLVESALSLAVVHAKSREQFGKPIAQFQGVQWKIADMSMESAAARLLTYRAAWSQEGCPEEFSKHAAMCKLFSSKVARFHSGEAIQVMGTRGISEESPLERFYRDAKLMEICQGTSEIQKVIIADELKV